MSWDWDTLDTRDFRAAWVVVGAECYTELILTAFEHSTWTWVFLPLTVAWVLSLFVIMGMRDLCWQLRQIHDDYPDWLDDDD